MRRERSRSPGGRGGGYGGSRYRVVVVVMTVVLDPLAVVVDTVLLTLNVPLHDILLSIEIILLYLLDEMILILRVMGLTMYRRGGVVRDMMTVLLGGHRRILGGMIMEGVIGEKHSLWH